MIYSEKRLFTSVYDSCQSSSQHIHTKIRLCNAQRNTEKPKNYISEPKGLTEHVQDHVSTIRKRLNKNSLFGSFAMRKTNSVYKEQESITEFHKIFEIGSCRTVIQNTPVTLHENG